MQRGRFRTITYEFLLTFSLNDNAIKVKMCFAMLLHLGHGEIRSIHQSKRKYVYKEVKIRIDSPDIWTYVYACVCRDREREKEKDIYIYILSD